MRKLISSITLVFLINLSAGAQRCAVGKINAKEYQEKKEQLQRLIDSHQNDYNRNAKVQDEIIRIPVVVHVIHSTASGEIGGKSNVNITNQQIYSQIRVLNEDYRKLFGTRGYNTNPVGADMEMEFFLATKDPDGNPTSGINRVYNVKKSYSIFTDLDLIASKSYWDSSKYLNIWVTNLGDLYLGYGEFPGANIEGLDARGAPARRDGIFVDYRVFGSQTGTAVDGIYTYGRTLTHEIGHWFGLIHTWGDEYCGTDYCDDTPQIEESNSTEQCRIVYSQCNGITTKNMIENYMDYSPDSCMHIFTQDQKERVRQVMNLSSRRKQLIANSDNIYQEINRVDFKVLNNPGDNQSVAFQVLLPDIQDFNIQIYDFFGRVVFSQDYTNYASTVISAADMDLLKGLYIVRFSSQNYITTKRVVVL